MSSRQQNLLIEGFLRKRRDKMKMKWVTYWFQLESKSLFFYSKKDVRPVNLRGQYFLCMVESVREVDRTESKRYVFEITLKNGKRKLLAAETALLRQSWVECLWKALQNYIRLGEPTLSSSWQNMRGLKQVNDGTLITSTELHGLNQEDQSSHQTSASGQWDCLVPKDNTKTSEAWIKNDYSPCREQDEEESSEYYHYEILLPTTNGVCDGPDDEVDSKEETEDYYSVPANRAVEDDIYLMDDDPKEVIYDVPLSRGNGRGFGQPGYREFTESIYDVPKSLLRKLSEKSLEAPSAVANLDDNDIFQYNHIPKVRRGSSAGWDT